MKTKLSNAEKKYKEDIDKAWRDIAVLERVLGQSQEQWVRNGLAPTSDSFAIFRMAVESEMDRLLNAVDHAHKLYAIYRRNDKRVPVNYDVVCQELLAA